MLQKIDIKEIMTTGEATRKYADKYFYMIITEIVDRADNDIGYVIFTADTRPELSKAPRAEYKGLVIASKIGGLVEPYPSFSGLEVVHYG